MKQKQRIVTSWERWDGMVNSECFGTVSFIDLRTKCVDTGEWDTVKKLEDDGYAVIFPTKSELGSENAILSEFLEMKGISVPVKKGARKYLREIDRSQEFYSYLDAHYERAFQEWCDSNDFELIYEPNKN